jgi:hypothetical protein
LREEHSLRVFENRVLRRIRGPKREEDGSWRKLHNNELQSLYSSPNIVRVINQGGLSGWTCGTHGRGVYRVLVGGPNARDQWEDLGVGGRIILRWTLWRYGSMGRNGLGLLRIGSGGGLL